ncbi:VOC family protein [Arhodomonas sp. AD133]|uniref:VOC family protein n=1 Tax=Arhodomonas sp. AD133 TaxID=3415009 RepID=UPI003EBFB89E
MASAIFVNLPVRDLEASKGFFRHLGFDFNPQFSNDDATGMVVADNIHVMLLTEPFFRTFTDKAVCDTQSHTEVLTCLSQDSREGVDRLVRLAVEAGGRVPRDPQDHGFMYAHAFEDLDGHTWELVYMEPNAAEQA